MLMSINRDGSQRQVIPLRRRNLFGGPPLRTSELLGWWTLLGRRHPPFFYCLTHFHARRNCGIRRVKVRRNVMEPLQLWIAQRG